MSINNNNEKVTAVFGLLFEKGEDGQIIEVPDENLQVTPTTQSFLFRGTLRLENGTYYLWPLSGGKFGISFKDRIMDLSNFINKIIYVTGRQSGDQILNAVLKDQQSTPLKSKTFKKKIDAELLRLATAAKEFVLKYKNVKGFVTARPGYKFINGRITKELAIVAVVDRKISLSSLPGEHQLPSRFNNYDVEVVSISPEDILKYRHPALQAEAALETDALTPSYLETLILNTEQTEALALEVAATKNNYVPPPHVSLDEVIGSMTVVCHVSPEGGWKTLSPFLNDTTEHLQVAMYDFSAPHLFDTLKSVLRAGVSLKMVYDGKSAAGVGKGSKEDDVKEETILNSFKRIAGRGFEQVPAWKGSQGICANSYHIKVAVQDRKRFWLSSGNWQSSNQPNEDFENNISLLPKYNREWNILIDNNKLSDIYHQFIDWDFEKSQEKPESIAIEGIELPEMFLPEEELEFREIARYKLFSPKKFTFTRNRPLKIQPILSPDNYLQYATEIIKSAKRTLYFQNQYIKLAQDITDEYAELLQLLIEKAEEVDDCRIILRAQRTDADRKMLEDLQAFGFNMSKILLMSNTHTKGIIADGERILIGSHNWSNAGVQYNRDASLLIFDEGIAQYYQDVFLHDWDKRTKKTHREEIIIVPQNREEISMLPDNLFPISWTSILT